MNEFYKKASKFLKLENSKETLRKVQGVSSSKKSDQMDKAEKRKAEEKRGNNPKKPRRGLANHKVPLPNYKNYHVLNASQDHI